MTNPNEPAYPKHPKSLYIQGESRHGLTKREYFAGMALLQEFADARQCNPVLLAKLAVETADALIAALNKEEPK